MTLRPVVGVRDVPRSSSKPLLGVLSSSFTFSGSLRTTRFPTPDRSPSTRCIARHETFGQDTKRVTQRKESLDKTEKNIVELYKGHR